MFLRGNIKLMVKEKSKSKLMGKNPLQASLLISHWTLFKVHVNPGEFNRALNNWNRYIEKVLPLCAHCVNDNKFKNKKENEKEKKMHTLIKESLVKNIFKK